jgi:hypothetical protein
VPTAHFTADLIVLLHFGFILFAAGGGLLVLRWPRLAWLHLPCVAWGFTIEVSGGVCPLTPLELYYRHAAGDAGYAGSFVEHYLVPLIYPPGLTRTGQVLLGGLLLLLNAVIYACLWSRRKKTSTRSHGGAEEIK